ncbi:MAG: glycoside hydrolase family 3 C-terminal domain-containing protein [Lachnospiraceae bacterium]|nr:glycoside hydrolase family 3 C-terminal domain-containing protein [Lachnospiraceae bacterium]
MERIKETTIQKFETEHIETVRRLAPECTVLLKNEGVLPLKEIRDIALYGSGARRTLKGGTGSGDVSVRHFVTIEEGLKNAGFRVTSGKWLDAYDHLMDETRKTWISEIKEQAKQYGVDPYMFSMGKAMPEPDYVLPLDAEGDTAIYVLSRISGEGSDREAAKGDIELSDTETRDILKLNEQYKNFILVLNVGGMVDLTPVMEVKSILLLGQLGTPTGDVCADILTGKSYPSGKLTMTWAPINDYPSTDGFGDQNDTRYQEGIYVGYRYFDTFGKKPLYPFGFGLSYTEFDTSVIDFDADSKTVKVKVDVKNAGSQKGKEIIQLYYSAPTGKLDKPYQELIAFEKTKELFPGECQELTLEYPIQSMASFDETQASYILEQGIYTIRVGNCSEHTTVCGTISICNDQNVKQVKNICAGWDYEDMKSNLSKDAKQSQNHIEIDLSQMETETVVYEKQPICQQVNSGIDWIDVMEGRVSVEEFAASLTEEEMIDLAIGHYGEGDIYSIIGNACTTVAGGAGETTHRLEDKHLDFLTMADGPAGLRLSKEYKVIDGTIKACDNSFADAMMEFMEEEQLMQMLANAPKEPETESYYQYCVAIPVGTGLAQSFNLELCEQIGDVVGNEMERFGINLWLAPALNIQRSPLCGRNFEYYSEDPLISGKIAAAVTRGVQKHPGCGTTIKHFAANNQETNRYNSNSIVSERALREIYLRGFEICIKESNPFAMMTSYNLVNGTHVCNNYDLLTSVLRDEWGYKGIVMTDWYATSAMNERPGNKYSHASAAGCVKAGNHLTTSGLPTDKEDMMNALKDGTHPYHLTIRDLQRNAIAVLYVIKDLKTQVK